MASNSSDLPTSSVKRLRAINPNHFWFQSRATLIDSLWKTVKLSSGQMVADVGIGLGSWLKKLHDQGYSVIAIDQDKSHLDIMRDIGENYLLIQADATSLPLADHCLEAVTLFDVLEHVADDEGALREVGRVLKTNGWLLMSVPTFTSLWSRRDEQAGHYRRYDRQKLVSLLQKYGFQIHSSQYYLCWIFPFFVLSRLLTRYQYNTLTFENRPPTWLNRLFFILTKIEVKLGNYIRWPFGSSIFFIARKQ